MTAMQEPLVMGPAVDGYTYTNEPKLTQLGPHRFMIPANYFSDQMGPDFQGGVTLEVIWPELEPLPPGRRRAMSMDEFRRQIRASIDYMKRPLQDAMDGLARTFSDDPVLQQDPLENISYRSRGDDVLGLQRWYVSEADKARYLKLTEGQRDRYGMPADPWDFEDWFVRRDSEGHILTFIRCAPSSMPDGLIIQEGVVVKDDNSRVAQCTHTFSVPEYGLLMRMDYPRTLMRDWSPIEQRYRALLSHYYLGDDSQGGRS